MLRRLWYALSKPMETFPRILVAVSLESSRIETHRLDIVLREDRPGDQTLDFRFENKEAPAILGACSYILADEDRASEDAFTPEELLKLERLHNSLYPEKQQNILGLFQSLLDMVTILLNILQKKKREELPWSDEAIARQYQFLRVLQEQLTDQVESLQVAKEDLKNEKPNG